MEEYSVLDEVLRFWFEEHGPEQWWAKDEHFDRLCRERFLDLHRQAALGELFDWRERAAGRLAEVILLDQFSRNLFRATAQAFAYDGMALALAQEAVRIGADRELAPLRRKFLYMPYMHSESAKIHREAVRLFTALGEADTLDFELKHQRIIERFGRYPHRNAILGRESTPAEVAFLQQPGSSF
jgi:uncharacterized protein (DUF924 family)